MKILHVIDSGGLYGAEVMLLNLMQEQMRAGDEPLLASIGDPGLPEKPIETAAKKLGINVAKYLMRPGPNFVGALTVLRFAWAEHVDVLHSHGYKGNILFGFIPRALRKIPMVSTLHGWTWSGGFSRMLLYEWFDSLSFSCIDRVILVNAAMKDHPRLKNRHGLSLEVVPNGIPVHADVPSDTPDSLNQTILDFCRRSFTIGAIGRLSPEKGFLLLIEVVAALVARGADIQLVILGEGGLRNGLEEAVRKYGIENRVLMPGYVPDAKRYLPLFNLFAMPSLTEGLPMVLLEAMHASVPIVATKVGGIPEVLKDGKCGILVDPGSHESLALALQTALNNPNEAAERVTAAHQRVLADYSSSAMASKYQKIYRDVLH
jgi:glycosyltransferase involved in cell wall biosynthesis